MILCLETFGLRPVASSPGGRTAKPIPLLSGDANRRRARRTTGRQNTGDSNVQVQEHASVISQPTRIGKLGPPFGVADQSVLAATLAPPGAAT